VPDLAGGAAAEPWAPVEDDAAADAGAPEDAEERAVRAPGAQQRLGVGRDLHVVAERHPRAERLGELVGQREAALPVGQVARARDRAPFAVDVARRADADALELRRLHARRVGGLAERLHHGGRDVGRPAGGRGRHAGLPAHVVV
jgi:hypothetical protein